MVDPRDDREWMIYEFKFAHGLVADGPSLAEDERVVVVERSVLTRVEAEREAAVQAVEAFKSQRDSLTDAVREALAAFDLLYEIWTEDGSKTFWEEAQLKAKASRAVLSSLEDT